MHAEHADKLAIGGRIGTQPHQGVGDRRIQVTRQTDDFITGVGQDRTAADIDERTLGLGNQLGRFLDLARMAAGGRLVAADADRLRIMETGFCLLDILGNVHHHRAGTAGTGNVECLLDGGGQLADILDEEVVLHARPGDADHVDFLEGIQPDGRRGDLPRQHHHRNRIHVGSGNAGNRIGRPRPGRDQRHAGLVAGARVAVSRVHRGLLVPYQYVLELVLLEDRVVDFQHCPAGVPEDVLDAFRLQTARDNFGAGDFHDFASL